MPLDFNPRPPHGGRPHEGMALRIPIVISTRAPRTEGDEEPDRLFALLRISTRAPRTEGDGEASESPSFSKNFNPRPPHGGRHAVQDFDVHMNLFQPAPPARRATHNPDDFTASQ